MQKRALVNCHGQTGARFRHELKFVVNDGDIAILRSRLSVLMQRDGNGSGTDGRYSVRSLYFDNYYDKALEEKLSGIGEREKFRIRFYNGNDALIKLEKKAKVGALSQKRSCSITRRQCESIMHGDETWMAQENDALMLEFYAKLKGEGMKPKTVVEYEREAYVHPLGNVRVTFDTSVRSGAYTGGFFENDLPMLGAYPLSVLEVKYDDFLPDSIRAVLQLGSRRQGTFSKYVACRVNG